MSIADLTAAPNNEWQRGATRMELAFALARTGRLDEAESLAEQAVALEKPARSPHMDFKQQLEQIRRMKSGQ